ncbi:MAG: acetate kinase, partial [Clostridiales bacterium]|nr:acetate kinase [Clostridiales bacterium]
MNVLVINAGSSSLKYQLFDMATEQVVAKGICERIGIGGHLKHTPVSNGKPVFDEDIALP